MQFLMSFYKKTTSIDDIGHVQAISFLNPSLAGRSEPAAECFDPHIPGRLPPANPWPAASPAHPGLVIADAGIGPWPPPPWRGWWPG